ncbi:hypothetical protein GCM10010909_20130 [Acidocella aquatica]|uniref:Uncharacterized protein n=1 Tax=Acidocella aquatica TaxID=1922313 RepID=A0ABQ6A7S7_9PROT|nr:hypothetical protein GCM10010909_20130 [Acidocella aquatica]
MAAGFRDGADNGGAFRAFEVAQLFFESGEAGGGHGKFLHCISSKRVGAPMVGGNKRQTPPAPARVPATLLKG